MTVTGQFRPDRLFARLLATVKRFATPFIESALRLVNRSTNRVNGMVEGLFDVVGNLVKGTPGLLGQRRTVWRKARKGAFYIFLVVLIPLLVSLGANAIDRWRHKPIAISVVQMPQESFPGDVIEIAIGGPDGHAWLAWMTEGPLPEGRLVSGSRIKPVSLPATLQFEIPVDLRVDQEFFVHVLRVGTAKPGKLIEGERSAYGPVFIAVDREPTARIILKPISTTGEELVIRGLKQ